MAGDAVCWGGRQCGRKYDGTADPPFGYRIKRVRFRGQTRVVFVQQHIRDAEIDLTILQNALRAADSCNER